ncbi:MAG: LicD family protein [Blautia sp.]|nr:LicD family protein [Blautia sp.]
MEYTKEQLGRLREIDLELYHKLEEICARHELRFVTGFGTTLGAIRHKGFIPWDDDMDFLMPREDYEKLIRIAPKELAGSRYELLEPRTTRDYVMAFAKLSRKDTVFLEAVDEHVRYHNGICIDIFPMDYWPQDKKARNRVAFKCYVLLRLCVLASYGRPKLPPAMAKWKRFAAYAGCMCIHGLMKLFCVTTPKLYDRYLRLATSTDPETADHYVTDMCWCWPRKDGMIGLQYRDEDLFVPLRVPFEDTTVPVPEKYDSYLKTAYRDYMKLPPVEKRHSHKPSVLVFPEEMGQEGTIS